MFHQPTNQCHHWELQKAKWSILFWQTQIGNTGFWRNLSYIQSCKHAITQLQDTSSRVMLISPFSGDAVATPHYSYTVIKTPPE